MHPEVHTCEDEIEAFLCVCLFIEDKFSPHVVQFEKFDSHLVAVRHKQGLLRLLCVLLLERLNFNEEIL